MPPTPEAPNDDDGGGGGEGGGDEGHDRPFKKRRHTDENQPPNDQNEESKSVENGTPHGTTPMDDVAPPLSPPHSLRDEDETITAIDDDDIAHNEEDISAPAKVRFTCKDCRVSFSNEEEVLNHIHSKDVQKEDTNVEKAPRHSQDDSKIPTAPRVVAKRPGLSHPDPEVDLEEGEVDMPTAPKIVCKRTGGAPPPFLHRKKKICKDKRTDLPQMRQNEGAPLVDLTPPAASPTPTASASSPTPSTSTGGATRSTRSSTGAITTQHYYGADDDDDFDFEANFMQNLMQHLPAPIPLAPEQGMVIRHGKWVSEDEAKRMEEQRVKNKVASSGTIRKYNYKPFEYTITGVSKPDTVMMQQQEKPGCYECPECDMKYEYERSLNVHMSRAHHKNHKAQCPECYKTLSNKSAIAKHLLSHRPREQWPYICPLCSQTFQAKGDLPKHFLTSRHQNDNIPMRGTPEWTALMEQTVRCPTLSKKYKPVVTSEAQMVVVDNADHDDQPSTLNDVVDFFVTGDDNQEDNANEVAQNDEQDKGSDKHADESSDVDETPESEKEKVSDDADDHDNNNETSAQKNEEVISEEVEPEKEKSLKSSETHGKEPELEPAPEVQEHPLNLKVEPVDVGTDK